QTQRGFRQWSQFINREGEQPERGPGKKALPEPAPAASPATPARRLFKRALDDLDFAHWSALRCNSKNSLAREKLRRRFWNDLNPVPTARNGRRRFRPLSNSGSHCLLWATLSFREV